MSTRCRGCLLLRPHRIRVRARPLQLAVHQRRPDCRADHSPRCIGGRRPQHLLPSYTRCHRYPWTRTTSATPVAAPGSRRGRWARWAPTHPGLTAAQQVGAPTPSATGPWATPLGRRRRVARAPLRRDRLRPRRPDAPRPTAHRRSRQCARPRPSNRRRSVPQRPFCPPSRGRTGWPSSTLFAATRLTAKAATASTHGSGAMGLPDSSTRSSRTP